MSNNNKIFHITLNVIDINTRIVLPEYEWSGLSTCPYRAERRAVQACKNLVLADWFRKTCCKYRLTALQLKRLVNDGIIAEPDLVEVTVANVESEPYITD